MLAGAILGPRRGALALIVFLTLVALGLPLLAGGRGGLGVFAGPSVGYLIGFPVAAFAVGALTYAAGAPYRVSRGGPGQRARRCLGPQCLGYLRPRGASRPQPCRSRVGGSGVRAW
ncbi:biotin transporter BioY [Nocardioides endophyticus]